MSFNDVMEEAGGARRKSIDIGGGDYGITLPLSSPSQYGYKLRISLKIFNNVIKKTAQTQNFF